MKRFILIIVSGLLCFVCCKIADLLYKQEDDNVVIGMAFGLCLILGLCFGLAWAGEILWVFLEIAHKIMGV